MNAQALGAALERKYPRGGSNAGSRVRRDRALAAFESHGYPTRRLEEWRYTDLRAIARAEFDYASAAPDQAALEAAAAALETLPYGPETRLAIFVDGVLSPQLSRIPESLEFEQTELRSTDPSADFVPPEPRHSLAALNEAFAAPMALRIGASFNDGQPIVMVFVAATAQVATHVRLDIDVAAGASANIVQHFVGTTGQEPGWTNLVMSIRQADNSKLELLRIQELSSQQSLTSLISPELAGNASLRFGTFDIGGAIIRTDVETVLAAPYASVDLFGLTTAADGQHVDNHLCADHQSADTRSSQTFRSIVDAGGRAIFNGKVIVRPDAQRIDARQNSDNLLLSRNAEVDTKPELEIYADDVRCSHGATIGELDDAELFYLQSRGIPADAARRLLTFGFANRLLLQIDDESIRSWLSAQLIGTLTGLPGLPGEQDVMMEPVE